jgi:hypothetical protein
MTIQREGFSHQQIGIEFKAATHPVLDVERGAENFDIRGRRFLEILI